MVEKKVIVSKITCAEIRQVEDHICINKGIASGDKYWFAFLFEWIKKDTFDKSRTPLNGEQNNSWVNYDQIKRYQTFDTWKWAITETNYKFEI